MAKKKDIGRPKKKASERRDRAILVRFTKRERQAVNEKAPYAVSTWIRDEILSKIK